jgi:chemotaxis protein methyltransferase CheR
MISDDESAALLERLLGFRSEPTRAAEVTREFAERLRVLGCSDARAYSRLLSEPRTRARETDALAGRLTVNETYFLRESAQLDVIADRVVPGLMAGGVSPVRVLSVGCSTGDEPYGLALRLEEAGLDFSRVEILGIDVSPNVITSARRAEYSERAIRNVPAGLRQRYLERDRKGYRLVERLRTRVRFEAMNLVDEDDSFWNDAQFEIVLCRNLLIYLTRTAIRLAMGRFARVLAPGGALFLGHAETSLAGSGFVLHEQAGAFYFSRREADEPSPGRLRRDHAPAAAAAQLLEPIERSGARVRVLAAPLPAPVAEPAPTEQVEELSDVIELIRQERFEAALTSVESCKAGEHSERWLLRAVILTNLGRTAEAARAAQTRLERVPSCPFSHYLLGVCSESLQNLADAQRQYERAADLEPAFAMALLRAGMLARRAGQGETARRALQSALEQFPRQRARTQLLYGGGFARETLTALCRAELSALSASRGAGT